MVKLKRSHASSKRMTLSKKYKIEKKCKEFNKRQKKLNKGGGPGSKRTKGHKNPGIPNAWPEKQKLLRQLEWQRLREERQKEEQKEQRKREREERRRMEKEFDEASEVEDDEEFGEDLGDESEDEVNERLACLTDLKEAIDTADIVFLVLDARDPVGTRMLPLERSILAQGKKVMLLLDNADMVPSDALQAWLTGLNSEHPTFTLASSSAKSSSLYLLRNTSVDLMLQLVGGYVGMQKKKVVPTISVVAYTQVDADRVVEQLAGKFVHVAKRYVGMCVHCQ